MDIQNLIQTAIDGLEWAYAPYSHFKVSAALQAKNGRIFTGVNVENASYSGTNCAERTAFFTAISQGVTAFEAIVILGGLDGKLSDYCPPCGICRQVMREFCDPKTFRIILAKSLGDFREFTLEELLPMGFGPDNLK